MKADLEGNISKEQLVARGRALAPGHVTTPAEALRPQPTEPKVPFSTSDTMSLEEIKRHGDTYGRQR